MPEYAVPKKEEEREISIRGPGWANDLSMDDISKLNELDVDGSKALFLPLGNNRSVVILGEEFTLLESGFSPELGTRYKRYRYAFRDKSSGEIRKGYLTITPDGYIELELNGQTYSYRPKEENGEWKLGAYDVSLEGTGADSLKVPNAPRIGFVTSLRQDIASTVGKELKNLVPTLPNQEENG